MEEKLFTMTDLNQEYNKGFISAMKCTIASLEHERNIFKKAFKDEKMISLQLVLNRFENIISACNYNIEQHGGKIDGSTNN